MKHRKGSTSVLSALIWFAASYGVAILGYLVANAVASRWLGLSGFASFVVVLTVSTVVGQLALLGTHRGGLREAALLRSGDEASLHVLRAGARVVTRITLPVAGVVAAVVTYVFIGGTLLERSTTAAGFGALVFLSGLQKLWANYLRGLGDVRFASMLEGRSGGGIVSLVQAALLAATWVLFPQTGLSGAVAALALGYLPPVLLAGRVARSYWRHVDVRSSLWADLRDAAARNWRFAVNQLGAYLSSNVTLWIAGLLLLSSQASLFAAAQRLSLLLVLPLTSIQVVFAPVSARLIASGETARLQRVLRTGATVATVVTAVLWVPLLVFPGPVLSLVFGSEFDDAATALVLLTLASVANVFTGLCGTALMMSRHEGLVAGIQVGAVVLQVGLGVLAAVFVGLDAVAASSAAVIALTFLVQWVCTKRLLGIWTQPTIRPSLGALRQTAS